MSADRGNPGDRREESPVDRCPEDVLGWILGYVDGTLSADERLRVEGHVAVCTECRRELDLIAGLPVELDFELPDPGRVFDEILARIQALGVDGSPGAHPGRSRDHRGRDARPPVEDWSEQDRARLRDWLLARDALEEEAHAGSGSDAARLRGADRRGSWGLGQPWRMAAAVLLVLLGGMGGAILSASLLPEPSGDGASVVYRPATEAGSPASFREGALDVVFREGSTALEIQLALRSLDAEIVAGPSAMGVYRVRVRGRAEGSGLDWLRDVADGLVAPGGGVAIFAEPIP